MFKTVLFWRKAFLSRDISVFSKHKLCRLSGSLLGKFSKSFYGCYYLLQVTGGNKDSGQMIEPVKNRTCPSSLEEREVDHFSNLTLLCLSY